MGDLKDLDRACFCSCCCLGYEERSLTASADCSCKHRLRYVIESLERANLNAVTALRMIERWASDAVSPPPDDGRVK